MPEFDSTTEYRPIPNFPGYVAGSDGSIWSNRTRGAAAQLYLETGHWRPLKQALSATTGYHLVTLCGNGRKISRSVHSLVLSSFTRLPEPGEECRHRDGNRSDSRLDNLVWGTRLENNQDKIAHGHSLRGEDNTNAKLTEDDVRMIRRLASEGYSGSSLARMFKMSTPVVCKIIRRELWKHVS